MDVILVLLICTGAVIVVVIVLDGTGIDSASAANVFSSWSSGGCTMIFSGALGLLGLLSVYPVGGGHGCDWEGRDGGVSSGFGESRYSPACVSLRGMSTPKLAPAK